MLWNYCYTDTLYTISSDSYPTGTRIHQFTGSRHHRDLDALYTVISCSYIIVTCIHWISIFLSYGSPFILHVLLLHVYSCIPITYCFLIRGSKPRGPPLESHIYCFPIPVILFYAINRAQVLLSCYMYHALYLFLLHCVL